MCIFHKWNPWAAYEQTGIAVLGKASGAPGAREQFVETRQFRNCKKCNKLQDEYVHDGPIAPNRNAN